MAGTNPGRNGALFWAGAAAIAAGLVAIALIAVLVVRPWDAASVVAERPVPVEPPPPPVLAAGTGGGGNLTAEQVSDALDELLADSDLGDRVSAAVVDVADGGSRYGWEADQPLVPASTIKLVTAAAVLATRGPAYELPTTVVAGEDPGEVVVVGGGDPTLALGPDGFYPDAARLDLLATQVRSALGDTPVTTVTVDATLFDGDTYGPWESSIRTSGFVAPVTALMADGGRTDPDPAQGQRSSLRFDDPDLAVGEAFAELLGGDAEVARGSAPTETRLLGQVHSPPVLRLVEIMLSSSDNTVAEVLARQVPLARDEPATFDATAAALTAVLTDLGLDLGDSVIADGSGLSRDNQLSAQLLADLLAVAAGPDAHPDLSGLFAGLPVAGWSGTLGTRHPAPSDELLPGVGTVRAKTGSLTAVDALAGVVVTADGRLLAFAVLADDVPVGRPASWEALDRIPAALADLSST